ncbi:MAG: integrase core domain-containing protein [bacterium]|nr:integrase core domain-containing protein [bacterium]
MIAREYVTEGQSTRAVLKIAGVAESSFYYKPTAGKRGRSATTTTMDAKGTVWTEEQLVDLITAELEKEFVDYGYIKVTKWLQHEHTFVINKKKVYRIMDEHALLHSKPSRSKVRKQWVKDLVPNPTMPLTHLEFDIKYMHIHGQRRNAMMLTVIDVKSRYNVGWLMQWSIKKADVVVLFLDIQCTLPMVTKITVRSDNGSQFVSHLVRDHFKTTGIEHEFTRPATPEQNAHIESYHSIVESVICRQYTFTDLHHANELLTRWVEFYNHKRIHSGTGYLSPAEYLRKNNVSLPQPLFRTAQLTNFSIN